VVVGRTPSLRNRTLPHAAAEALAQASEALAQASEALA